MIISQSSRLEFDHTFYTIIGRYVLEYDTVMRKMLIMNHFERKAGVMNVGMTDSGEVDDEKTDNRRDLNTNEKYRSYPFTTS